MTPQEFKAWFEGFTEAMDGQPTPSQWEKVKLRVSQIDGRPVSYPIYLDRYWSRPVPYPRWPETWCASNSGTALSASSVETLLNCASPSDDVGRITAEQFDPLPAMKALGLADYSDASA